MLNKLFKNHYFLATLQFLTLFVFILLIYGAIGITTNDKDFAIILRNTNLANLIVWSYWWPFIIVTAVLFGRFWCSICPMELITSFFGKIGMRKKPGKLLKSGWFITLFYALILIIGIHTFAIHRIPQLMAVYMIILLAVAIIAGIIWEKRAFCTYICPVGHLLGLYSLLSFKQLRVKSTDVCKNCKTKDCVSKVNHYKFTGRSCTSELYPPDIRDNRECILCGQCHKSCTKDNIEISQRKIAADLFTGVKLSTAEIGFFMLVSGFIVYEILSEWQFSKDILLALPHWLNSTLGISGNLAGTVKAIILFIIVPLIAYTGLAMLKKYAGKESLRNAFAQLVTALLPVAGSLHLLKALLKTTSRIPYWHYVFGDPQGIKTATMLQEKSVLLDKSFLVLLTPFINILAILLPLGGLLLSFIILRKQKFASTTSQVISFAAVIIYATLFLITIVAWRLV